MKFGQLIEYNLRNIFLLKSYTECGGEASPRPSSEKLGLNISLDQNSLKFYTVCFDCMPSWRLSKYIETKLQTVCLYLILSFSNKQRSGTCLPASFSV